MIVVVLAHHHGTSLIVPGTRVGVMRWKHGVLMIVLAQWASNGRLALFIVRRRRRRWCFKILVDQRHLIGNIGLGQATPFFGRGLTHCFALLDVCSHQAMINWNQFNKLNNTKNSNQNKDHAEQITFIVATTTPVSICVIRPPDCRCSSSPWSVQKPSLFNVFNVLSFCRFFRGRRGKGAYPPKAVWLRNTEKVRDSLETHHQTTKDVEAYFFALVTSKKRR